jgi:hypothetical protein
MFGLLIGMSIFSAMSLQWSKQELARTEQRRAEMAKAQADDMAKAMEFAAMTETRNTYSERFNLDRARQYAGYSGGRTRGGQDMIVVSKEDDRHETFGDKNQRVAITSSDDTLLRAKVYRAADADAISHLDDKGQKPIATFDTSGVRERQVLTSQKAMEGIAEQLYAFYGAHMRFPTSDEYDHIKVQFPFVDAWGSPFDYSLVSDDEARLEFTTPWNYTQSLKLSLKDDTATVPASDTTVSGTSVSGTSTVSDSQ